jgi:hypothetical protein
VDLAHVLEESLFVAHWFLHASNYAWSRCAIGLWFDKPEEEEEEEEEGQTGKACS